MSAATGVDLQAAMNQINATFDGTAGRLTRLIPGLMKQLENGDAVAIIEKQYKGLSDSLANSTEVSIKNNQNAWKELFGAIGQGISGT